MDIIEDGFTAMIKIDCDHNLCHNNFNRKELERKCKKAYFNNYYIKTIENIKADGRYLLAIIDNFVKDLIDLLYIHSPKLLLIGVISAFGGLISMWFGIDLFRFTTYFLKYLSNFH